MHIQIKVRCGSVCLLLSVSFSCETEKADGQSLFSDRHGLCSDLLSQLQSFSIVMSVSIHLHVYGHSVAQGGEGEGGGEREEEGRGEGAVERRGQGEGRWEDERGGKEGRRRVKLKASIIRQRK